MADVVDKATRSRMMAGIRSKNTKPELTVRKALHKMGFRFRLHALELPGKPDIKLPKYQAVIRVQGCFWHGHNCQYFKLPSTRREFWETKIFQNVRRDSKNKKMLLDSGWRVATFWECAIRDKSAVEINKAIRRLATWLKAGNDGSNEIEVRDP